MSSQRPFITCHVLDTTTGKPGADIKVGLELLDNSRANLVKFEAQTNADGRVTGWSSPDVDSMNGMVNTWKTEAIPGHQMIWKLTVDTEGYFGTGKTFFPQVDIIFSTALEEHYHVPLLLGPYSYTTYRGS